MSKDMPVKLSDIANPYDFANPVSKKQLFVGRRKEQEDIEYYLNLAKTADRAINLALLGERAAGKTSLLNIIAIEAESKELVPVRIDLNESDVTSPLIFWFKIIDAIFQKVVEEPNSDNTGRMFGGEQGKTYQTYMDIIIAYEVPEDKAFCPFSFPTLYAKAMNAGNAAKVIVSDQILKRDLKRIADEVDRPIVLLLDECNTLSGNRSLLEMVRNTFMNLPGFMLVFTGTPDLFPVMDEVFSPIIRQFKKLKIEPFAKELDTLKAIMKPLESVGQEDLFEGPNLVDLEELEDLEELPKLVHWALRRNENLFDIHVLTAGRPYEIQLVCHYMFKRVQDGHDKAMRLNNEVLEDVLSELRQSHDEDTRPVISAVKRLDHSELQKLRIILASGGKIPIEKVLIGAFVTCFTDQRPTEWPQFVKHFSDLGIVSEVQDCVEFRGDAFDEIFCKYAAQIREVKLLFRPTPLSRMFISRLRLTAADLGKTTKYSRAAFRMCVSGGSGDAELEGYCQLWQERNSDWTVADMCRQHPELWNDVYPWYDGDDGRGATKCGGTLFRIDVDVADDQFTMFWWADRSAMQDTAWPNVPYALSKLSRRAKSVGGTVEVDSFECHESTTDELWEVAGGYGEPLGRYRHHVRWHAQDVVQAYSEGDRERAIFHASRASTSPHLLSDQDASNFGYVLMSYDRLKDAKAVLQKFGERSNEYALGKYNLGLALLLQNEMDAARDTLSDAARLAKDAEDAEEGYRALLIPKYSNGRIIAEEIRFNESDKQGDYETVRLADYAKSACKLIQEAKDKMGS